MTLRRGIPSPREQGEGTPCSALNCEDSALSDFRKDIVAIAELGGAEFVD